jgi:hypothetical protein
MRLWERYNELSPAGIKLFVFWSLVAIMCAGLVVGVLLPESARLRDVRSREAALARTCDRIEAGNQYLSEGLGRLEMRDRATWDRVIRARLHWVGAGEEPAPR